MTGASPALRKPVFTKASELRPGTNGGGRPSGPQARQMRIAECVVGDETGIIIFTARNDQGQNTIHIETPLRPWPLELNI
ncbi:hypothetical protein BRARA_F01957 [Brassica rapa]|uniref:Single-stranded DNA binding protein Ssb-like OB fold domain-containing protein n=1 Tax=Brassica campestris TaxID=3711 RepID=A0A397Z1B8_BRACM|nr:hypothetical protein BRARA_F01957 [Brassica rapa]